MKGGIIISFNVIFYETKEGKLPAEEFINSQDSRMRDKIARDIGILKIFGNALRMPYSEHLQDGIFQLRTQLGNNISRVLYFFYDGKDIIFTNGFNKKTRTTPPKEIEKAKKYREDYFERKNNNENV